MRRINPTPKGTEPNPDIPVGLKANFKYYGLIGLVRNIVRYGYKDVVHPELEDPIAVHPLGLEPQSLDSASLSDPIAVTQDLNDSQILSAIPEDDDFASLDNPDPIAVTQEVDGSQVLSAIPDEDEDGADLNALFGEEGEEVIPLVNRKQKPQADEKISDEEDTDPCVSVDAEDENVETHLDLEAPQFKEVGDEPSVPGLEDLSLIAQLGSELQVPTEEGDTDDAHTLDLGCSADLGLAEPLLDENDDSTSDVSNLAGLNTIVPSGLKRPPVDEGTDPDIPIDVDPNIEACEDGADDEEDGADDEEDVIADPMESEVMPDDNSVAPDMPSLAGLNTIVPSGLKWSPVDEGTDPDIPIDPNLDTTQTQDESLEPASDNLPAVISQDAQITPTIRIARLKPLSSKVNNGPAEPRIFESGNIKISNIKFARARGSITPVSIIYVWDKKGNYVGQIQRREDVCGISPNPKYKKYIGIGSEQLLREAALFADERYGNPQDKIDGKKVMVSDCYTADGGINMADVYVDKVDPFGDKYKYLICRLYVQFGYKTDWELYKCTKGVSVHGYAAEIDEAIKIANKNFPGITNGDDIDANGVKVNLSLPYVNNLARRARADMDAVVDDVKLIDVYDKENNLIGRLYRYSDDEWREFGNFTSTIPSGELNEYIKEALELANLCYQDEPIAKNGPWERFRNWVTEVVLNKL